MSDRRSQGRRPGHEQPRASDPGTEGTLEIEVGLPEEGDPEADPGQGAVERAEAARREAEDKYLRALADLDNLRKRLAREKTDWLTWGYEPVVKDFLPIVDNLERAVSATREAAAQGGEASPAVQRLLEGVELTLRQFGEALERHGVTPIESLGQAFDPKIHEAVARVERDDLPPGTVVAEFLRGYRFRDRLLRPAQVSVSVEGKEASPDG